MPDNTIEQQLRKSLRQQRSGLSPQIRQLLSKRITWHIRQSRLFRNARHIALYLPVRGEADPSLLRTLGLARQQFYLPVLSPFGDKRLWFVHWDKQTRFRNNRFRIPEPYPPHVGRRHARWLDIVITPLVAFDQHGSRLGMGGGYYDRTFAFKKRDTRQQRPVLCGFAYAFQSTAHISRQAWDVPLDTAVTETGFFRFNTRLY